MSRNQTPKYAKPGKTRLVPVLCAVAAVLALALAGTALAVKHTGEPSAPTDAVTPSEIRQPEKTAGAETAPRVDVQFPCEPEDGLEVTSLFSYTGANPDCGWTEGTGTGAVIVKNDTGRYLETLELTVTMADGSELSFGASDIPHGKTVWAFERENRVYDEKLAVAQIRCKTQYREGNGLAPDKVQVTAKGMDVTLTNVSGQTLTGLEIRCHNIQNGIYFGGTSYTYPVAEIPADGSATVLAAGCVLGEAATVRVDYTDQ